MTKLPICDIFLFTDKQITRCNLFDFEREQTGKSKCEQNQSDTCYDAE